MEESTHCNTLEHRWTLRHHGVALSGPPTSAVVQELPPGALREELRRQVPGLLEATRAWVDVDEVARASATSWRRCAGCCSHRHGRCRLEGASMLWVAQELAPERRPLIEAAKVFARYAASIAQDL